MANATENVYDCFINNVQQWANEHNIDADAARYEPLPEPVDQAFLGPEYDFTPDTYLDKAWLTSWNDAMDNLERGTMVVGAVGHATAAATRPQVHRGTNLTVILAFYGQQLPAGGNGFYPYSYTDQDMPTNAPGPSSAPAEPRQTTTFSPFGFETRSSYPHNVSAPTGLDNTALSAGANGQHAESTRRTTLLDRTNTIDAQRGRKAATPSQQQNIPQAAGSSAEAGSSNARGSTTQHGLGPHAQSNQTMISRSTAHAFEDLDLGLWAILLHLHPFDADLGDEEEAFNEALSGARNSKAVTQASASHPLECMECSAKGTSTFHANQAALTRHAKGHEPGHHVRCTMCAAVVLNRKYKVKEHWEKKCKAYGKLREKHIAWHWAKLYDMFIHPQFAGHEYLW